jgi:hypothetical protein
MIKVIEVDEDEVSLGEEGVLLCDGFEAAFLGVVSRFGFSSPVACYDYSKIIEILMEDGCDYQEAVEHFDYNVIGAWVGDLTPVFLVGCSLETIRGQGEAR